VNHLHGGFSQHPRGRLGASFNKLQAELAGEEKTHCAENPRSQLSYTKKLNLAARVGFVPGEPTRLKGLGPIGTARTRQIR
jgi:hypothetical protein